MKEPISMPPGTEGKKDIAIKPHVCSIDPNLLYEMGKGMRHGANKHGFNNHRKLSSDGAQQILDSLMRHMLEFLKGQELDEEQGISNLACMANNLNFLYRITRIYGYDKVIENIYGETK